MDSMNYLQRVGNTRCIRCDFETDASKPFAEQDADLMEHLTAKHPNWMFDDLAREQAALAALKQGLKEDRLNIQIKRKILTVGEVFDGLMKIHDDLQERFHDKWDWMKFSLYVESLRNIYSDHLAEVERLKAQLAGLQTLSDSYKSNYGSALDRERIHLTQLAAVTAPVTDAELSPYSASGSRGYMLICSADVTELIAARIAQVKP